ncbi:hypothetical protein [Streptomyces sp. Amel2xC10]|uniref:hypothetical protein n=1 Tax=Streptomyces sp. Amel2xC10 TaxID=1305826 RepID=UPI000A090C80|nr:hypothetical protein [Streptomyces sp. Amel2xC10]SMF86110.1 hypothetical protein SAMN02745830_07123 [Streptomyces sp. Amel2xC10]
MSEIRDVDEAVRQAMIEEWASYAAAGRTAQAAHVAKVLLADYGHDVNAGKTEREEAVEPPAPENAVVTAPPETVVDAKPETAGRPRAAARKAAAKPAGKDA